VFQSHAMRTVSLGSGHVSFDKLKEVVIDASLCEGCGLCAGACKAISLVDKKPELTGRCILKSGAMACGLCYNLCPQANPEMVPEDAANSLLNKLSLRVKDEALLQSAAYGGFVSGLVKFLLEQSKVKAVVTIAGEKYSPEPVIITDTKEMQGIGGTRYSQSGVLEAFYKALSTYGSNIAVVGLPCEMRGIARVEQRLGIKVTKIGLFCSNNQIVQPDGKKEKMGSCEYCTDFIATHADVSAGFAGSQKGYTTVLALTEYGTEIIDTFMNTVDCETADCDYSKIIAAQKRKSTRSTLTFNPDLRTTIVHTLHESGPQEIKVLMEALGEKSEDIKYNMLVLQQLGKVTAVENKQNPYEIKWKVQS
jgi:coenzyme F420-reducing hydrogenase beta subunit